MVQELNLERFSGFVVHTTGLYSKAVQTFRDISLKLSTFGRKHEQELGSKYKGKTNQPLKARLEKHQKAIIWGVTLKLGRADHV